MFGDGCGKKGFSQRIATGEFGHDNIFGKKLTFLNNEQKVYIELLISLLIHHQQYDSCQSLKFHLLEIKYLSYYNKYMNFYVLSVLRPVSSVSCWHGYLAYLIEILH